MPYLLLIFSHLSVASLFSSPILSHIDEAFSPTVDSWKDGGIGTLLQTMLRLDGHDKPPRDDIRPVQTTRPTTATEIVMTTEDFEGNVFLPEEMEEVNGHQKRRLMDAVPGSSCIAGADVVSSQAEGNITDSLRDLTSPTNYRAGMNCTILVKPPPLDNAFRVSLQFTTFQLEGAEDPECQLCSCDYMSVQDDADVSLAFPWGGFVNPNYIGVNWPLSGRFCGLNRYDFLSSSPSLRVSFNSDGAVQYQGFVARYSRVAIPAHTVKFEHPRYYVTPNVTSLAIDVTCTQCDGSESVTVQPLVAVVLNGSLAPVQLPAYTFPSYPLTFAAGSSVQTVTLPISSWLPCQLNNSASCVPNAFGVSLAQRNAWMLVVGFASPSSGVVLGTQVGQFRQAGTTNWNSSTPDLGIRGLVADPNTPAIVTVTPTVAVVSIAERIVNVPQDQTEVMLTIVCRDCSGVNVVASLTTNSAQVLLTNTSQVIFLANASEESARAAQNSTDVKRLTFTVPVTHSGTGISAAVMISVTLCPQTPYPNQPCTASSNGTLGATRLNPFSVTEDPSKASTQLNIAAAGCSDLAVRLTAARPQFRCVERLGSSGVVTAQSFIDRTSLPGQRVEYLSRIQASFGDGICSFQRPAAVLSNVTRQECALQCLSPSCIWYSYCEVDCHQNSEYTCMLFDQTACYLTSDSNIPDYVSYAPTASPTTLSPSTSTPTTLAPTTTPTTLAPTGSPTTLTPTATPTTLAPTANPTTSSTSSPTTTGATAAPTQTTLGPTAQNTSSPTTAPTSTPTTSVPTTAPTMAPTLSPTTSSPTIINYNVEHFVTYRSPNLEEVCGPSLLNYFNLSTFEDLLPEPRTSYDTPDAVRVAAVCGISSLYASSENLNPAKAASVPSGPRQWYCRALITCAQRAVCTAGLEAKDACVCPLDRIGDKCFSPAKYFCTLIREGSPSSADRAASPFAATILPSDCDANVFKKFPEYSMDLGGTPPCQSISTARGASAVQVPLRLQCKFADYPYEGVKSYSLINGGWSYPNVHPVFNYTVNTVKTLAPTPKSNVPYYSTVDKAEPALPGNSSNFTDYVSYCNARGKRLPSFDELCPLGVGRPAVIPSNTTLYVPILNGTQESWVQVGPHPTRICTEVEEGGSPQGMFACVSLAGHWSSEDESLTEAARVAQLPAPTPEPNQRVVRDDIDRGFAFSAADPTQFVIANTIINYNRPAGGQLLGHKSVLVKDLPFSHHEANFSAAGLPDIYSVGGRISIEMQLFTLYTRPERTSLVFPSGLAARAVTTQHFEKAGWTPPPPRETERSSGLTFVLNIVVVVCIVAFCGLARLIRECLRNKTKQS